MDFFSRLFRAITELHPTHPMTVHFPIALSGAAFLFILIAWWKKNEALEKAAIFNLALVAFSTVLASITGIASNANNYAGAAPNAGLKIILGIALFVISSMTSYLRWRNPDLFYRKNTKTLYFLAFLISFLLALVLGFLGGVILYGF